MDQPFPTTIERDGETLRGPWRHPRQMLGDQAYDGHASVHDDSVAADLGLVGAPIEGPTHFSQFDPIGFELFGDRWFAEGCISAHFENMVVEGEDVQASARLVRPGVAEAEAVKRHGDRVLTASMTVGNSPTLLDERLAAAQAREPGDLFIIDRLERGMTSGPHDATMTMDERNGDLYPFSLAQKLSAITEPSPWFRDGSPWGPPIVPTEMLSVMAHRAGASMPVRGPSIGLFIDLEVRRLAPVLVDDPLSVTHEVVALGQSRRVESYWTRSTIRTDLGDAVATVLLHQGIFKASYEGYPSTDS
ncbi:MAG: hypothetical protein ACO39Q_10375 [Ilumatobacteraceae bacterium]